MKTKARWKAMIFYHYHCPPGMELYRVPDYKIYLLELLDYSLCIRCSSKKTLDKINVVYGLGLLNL
jgi:hypothetical protein